MASMSVSKVISGFSKLSKEEKVSWLATHYFVKQPEIVQTLKQYWHTDDALQRLHDDFIENAISNFYLPYGVAPNFIINNKSYAIPMVIEESSVIAASALTAKFWSTRGGFKATVLSTTKVGHVHFMYSGEKAALERYFKTKKESFDLVTAPIVENMKRRGGGILDIQLVDKTEKLQNYYQLFVRFETVDSMGANFINSCLEAIAQAFQNDEIEVVMSILSNYVPECLVKAEVKCKIEDLGGENPQQFAKKFYQAVQIATVEPYRAVTHNKGVMNGIDAVVQATGNDFRAIEAGIHAHASSSGHYSSVTHCKIAEGIFHFWIEVPMALGTVGGLTSLHPLAKVSLKMLQNPSAKELMMIIAVAGLAQNYGALSALTTKGIQYGHMKMHLMNILHQLGANKTQREKIVTHFKGKTITHNAVVDKYNELRKCK